MTDPPALHPTTVRVQQERCVCGHLRYLNGREYGHATPPPGSVYIALFAEPCQHPECDCSHYRPKN